MEFYKKVKYDLDVRDDKDSAEQGGGEEDGAGETLFDQTGQTVDFLVADPANKTRPTSST